MKKPIIHILLCILGLAVSASMYAGEAPAEFTGPTWWDFRDKNFSIEGKGTWLNPIVINTPEELAQLSYLNYNYTPQEAVKEKVVVLGADINLKKTVNGQRVQWIPIGYQYMFTGIFLGVNPSKMGNSDLSSAQRHTISGMYINMSASDAANIKTQKGFGLFSRILGYAGYVNITDASISVDLSNSTANMWVGILSGISNGTAQKYETAPSKSITVNPAIDAVSVSGILNVVGNTNQTFGVGGVTAAFGHYGIFHSTSEVSINATNCNYVGGIVGSHQQTYKDITIHAITDCSATANITCTYEGTAKNAYAGGIVGEAHNSKPMSIYACSSAGSINCAGQFYAGGISGNMLNTVIKGCASMVNLSGNGELGGIVGHMEKVSSSAIELTCCTYSGHIDATQATYAGGLCGYMDRNDTEEHINGCLFTGTMAYTPEATNYSVTVGACSNPDNLKQNVTYCYFDKTLYNSNIAPGMATLASFQVKGLTTEELTSADVSKLEFLSTDKSASHGFRLTKGFYPEVYNNNTSYVPEYDYYALLGENDGNGQSEIVRQLFCSSYIYKDNTVYRTGAWLCSLPFVIPKGDVAYDLVTHVVAPSRNAEWTEQNRSIKLNSKYAFQNLPCIKVSNDTAFVAANGTFTATLTAKPDRPTAVWNRPTPFSLSKTLSMVSTIDQVWDGTTATSFAAGTGTKEDPYLIKNGAQLAYAMKNNKEGECYKQMCDITLNKYLVQDNGIVYYSNSKKWLTSIVWNAIYDGDSHFVKGALINKESGLFGNIAQTGEVSNLGIVDCALLSKSGAFAYQMNGKISNCITEGLATPINASDKINYHKGYCGGIASVVGNTNPNAVIEDCVSAMSCDYFMSDYTPFVSLSDENKGVVQNCIFVVPVGSDDATFSGTHSSASGHTYIKNCYWLRGYEPLNTGCTLDEMGNAITKSTNAKLWTWNKGYFPMLKSFAKTDMGKLLSLPFRSDIDYTFDENSETSSNYLIGISKQITFEPGSAKWTNSSTSYMEVDADMGIIAPIRASFTPQAVNPELYNARTIVGKFYLICTLGKFKHNILMRTSDVNVAKGITFVDENARQACLDAFDTNNDRYLSLSELKAATNEQTLTAFQTPTAKRMVQFPEFRFFKNVTELTTQLNGLSQLEEVQLPYALTTIAGGESDETSAFYGCKSLKSLTIPAKMTGISGHPFYGSAIENITIDPMNADFVSRNGVLFDVNNVLLAYPNGRAGEEVVFEGTINEIAKDAIYKIDGLKNVFFETEDYNTVPYLNENGIVSTDNELMDVYVSDATYGSVLMQGYSNDASWNEYVNANKLHCYYPLRIGNAKAATLYIGFDTQLPSALTPYTIIATNDIDNTATLKQMSRKVPHLSPIVIFASQPGLYRLKPTDTQLDPWKMYENRLNGVGRDGMPVYQSDSDRGSILTLGRNSNGDLGFYYYKGERIPPYRAYLTYEDIIDQNAHFRFVFDDDSDETVNIDNVSLHDSHSTLYDLQGRPVESHTAKPGIYIWNGRKVLKK